VGRAALLPGAAPFRRLPAFPAGVLLCRKVTYLLQMLLQYGQMLCRKGFEVRILAILRLESKWAVSFFKENMKNAYTEGLGLGMQRRCLS
jgi:hypothetical protein